MKKIHSILIHNSPKSRNSQIFVNRWVDHHIMCIYSKEFCKQWKEWTIGILSKMNVCQKMILSTRSPTQESMSPLSLYVWSSETGQAMRGSKHGGATCKGREYGHEGSCAWGTRATYIADTLDLWTVTNVIQLVEKKRLKEALSWFPQRFCLPGKRQFLEPLLVVTVWVSAAARSL